MYIYVLLFILVILLCVSAWYARSLPESFDNPSSNQPDWESLRHYCAATERPLESYKNAVVTSQYPQEAEWVYSVVRSTPCDWANDVTHWSLAITDGSVEYGYAFTMGHTMYLPIAYLQNVNESTKKELVFHELRHIWQRQNYSKFIETRLDPEVWRDWKFVVMRNPTQAAQKIKKEGRSDAVINPDTFQVVSYYKDSKHPVYPIKQSWGLEYVIKDHSQKITWNDPHPCEWDARDAAQKIL